MKYIDAEKLIAEIERQQIKLIVLSGTAQVDIRRDCALQNGVYTYILGLITSLQQEQPKVDLEKEMANMEFMGVNDARDIRRVARHFYELGLKTKKGGKS